MRSARPARSTRTRLLVDGGAAAAGAAARADEGRGRRADGRGRGGERGAAGAVVFDARLSDEVMAERLIEGPLVRMLRSAGEGQVPAAGYAAMVLLQQVCHCTVETPSLLPTHTAYADSFRRGMPPPEAWTQLSPEQKTAIGVGSRIADGCRHAVAPYLSLRAEPVAFEAAPPSPSTRPAVAAGVDRLVVSSAARLHAGWGAGARLSAEQRRRAACCAYCPCVRFDAGLAPCRP